MERASRKKLQASLSRAGCYFSAPVWPIVLCLTCCPLRSCFSEVSVLGCLYFIFLNWRCIESLWFLEECLALLLSVERSFKAVSSWAYTVKGTKMHRFCKSQSRNKIQHLSRALRLYCLATVVLHCIPQVAFSRSCDNEILLNNFKICLF